MAAGGFIKLYRSIEDWEWYNDIPTCRLFLHLLLRANHKEMAWKGMVLPPGSYVSSIRELSKQTNLSIQQVRTALSHLLSTHEITQSKTNKYSVFTVSNYEKYQETNTQTNNQPTRKQHTNNTQATQEQECIECKECIEVKDTLSGKPDQAFLMQTGIDAPESPQPSAVTPFEDVVSMLNHRVGTSYKPTTKATRSLIEARFAEGYTLADFRTVIEKKAQEWMGDSKMEKFLRPETLFGKKFEAYLNQPWPQSQPKQKTGGLPDWYSDMGDQSVPSADVLAEIEDLKQKARYS